MAKAQNPTPATGKATDSVGAPVKVPAMKIPTTNSPPPKGNLKGGGTSGTSGTTTRGQGSTQPGRGGKQGPVGGTGSGNQEI